MDPQVDAEIDKLNTSVDVSDMLSRTLARVLDRYGRMSRECAAVRRENRILRRRLGLAEDAPASEVA